MTSALWSPALGQEPQEAEQTPGPLAELARRGGSNGRGQGPGPGAGDRPPRVASQVPPSQRDATKADTWDISENPLVRLSPPPSIHMEPTAARQPRGHAGDGGRREAARGGAARGNARRCATRRARSDFPWLQRRGGRGCQGGTRVSKGLFVWFGSVWFPAKLGFARQTPIMRYRHSLTTTHQMPTSQRNLGVFPRKSAHQSVRLPASGETEAPPCGENGGPGPPGTALEGSSSERAGRTAQSPGLSKAVFFVCETLTRSACLRGCVFSAWYCRPECPPTAGPDNTPNSPWAGQGWQEGRTRGLPSPCPRGPAGDPDRRAWCRGTETRTPVSGAPSQQRPFRLGAPPRPPSPPPPCRRRPAAASL